MHFDPSIGACWVARPQRKYLVSLADSRITSASLLQFSAARTPAGEAWSNGWRSRVAPSSSASLRLGGKLGFVPLVLERVT